MRMFVVLLLISMTAGCGLLLDPDPPAAPRDATVRDGSTGDGSTADGSPGDGATSTCEAGDVCRVAVDACDVAELCDGSGDGCPSDAHAPAGTPCPGGACDGVGTCVAECVEGGACETGKPCEIGVWRCDPAVGRSCVAGGLRGRDFQCRPAAGECDVPETCDGENAECPEDVFRGEAHACRPEDSADPCDAPEFCDGMTAACPGDGTLPSATPCGPGLFCTSGGECAACLEGDDCTPLGTCELHVVACAGGAPDCRASGAALPSGRVCRPAPGICDAPEVCDGTSPACPADAVLPAGTECRARSGLCDVAELCNGIGARCPLPNFASATMECRASAGPCDEAEFCTGTSNACPSDTFARAGTSCGSGIMAGACDAIDVCTGAGPSCPPAFLPSGTLCRAGNACREDAFCSGSAVICPLALTMADGSLCGCGQCSGGMCQVAMGSSLCMVGEVCCIDAISGAGLCHGSTVCPTDIGP